MVEYSAVIKVKTDPVERNFGTNMMFIDRANIPEHIEEKSI